MAQNNKYANNYDYHKAVWLLNREELIENGFLLVKEDSGWVSPVGTLYYGWYDALDDVRQELEAAADNLQCVATEIPESLKVTSVPTVPLGQSQKPNPWDYADGVDTLNFYWPYLRDQPREIPNEPSNTLGVGRRWMHHLVVGVFH